MEERVRVVAGIARACEPTEAEREAPRRRRRRRPRALELTSDRVSRQRLADAYESITVQRQGGTLVGSSPSVLVRSGKEDGETRPDAFYAPGKGAPNSIDLEKR